MKKQIFLLNFILLSNHCAYGAENSSPQMTNTKYPINQLFPIISADSINKKHAIDQFMEQPLSYQQNKENIQKLFTYLSQSKETFGPILKQLKGPINDSMKKDIIINSENFEAFSQFFAHKKLAPTLTPNTIPQLPGLLHPNVDPFLNNPFIEKLKK